MSILRETLIKQELLSLSLSLSLVTFFRDRRSILQGFLREALKKDLSLSLGSGRIRLREAPCGAGVAFFRGFLGVSNIQLD
jgi:hypothetical protein